MAIDYAGSRRTGVRRRRSELAEATSFVRRLDLVLLGAVGALVAYGLWAIAGITHSDVTGDSNVFVVRQAVFAAVGAVALAGAALVDPDVYRRYHRPIYVGTAALMLFVFLAAPLTRGSRRWIDVGFFRFQPSEFGKLLFVLALAGFLAQNARRLGEVRTTLSTLGLASIPILLVFIQPDFGTALVYTAALAAVLFVGGTRWTHLAVLGAAAVLGAMAILWLLPAAGIHPLKPYQERRIVGFTDPGSDPSDATYNVNQSITAVGAGGVSGRGVANATQTSYNFLPEHATDFVFASFAEQRGFVGASVLLLLYLLVVWRGLRVVALARDSFSAIAAGGIVVAFLFQVFVNVGMTMGVAPITGIPLPFVSVGGSSMIANLTAVGVLLAIHARGRGMPR
ncbi:MAG: rod shape-determining protein RodA [Actinomycetota bacterium]|nr:rod shape-determining protein RodA [Actinomycetota bacterium]